ncbi:MAG: tetraacyldisaccharide 4'-kinase [Planctomycetota bacterium]
MPVVGGLLEPLYRAAVDRRNRAFDRGDRVTRFGVPIISVGNLSVGGTGKTPTVRLLVERLLARGRTPAIAMRGYKARAGERSDEEAEYIDSFPDVRVVAQPDRVSGIRALLSEHPRTDCVVLDDAFQHRYVARDLDIVLVDATRSPFEDRCLPAGWLREPVASLARADLIVVTRADTGGAIDDRLRSYNAPIVRTAHAWEGFTDGSETRLPPAHLDGKRAIVCCAIGHPLAFVEQCERAGCEVRGVRTERDHHAWTASEASALERLAASEDAVIVTTRKDWVKLRRYAADPARYAVPRLAIRPDAEGSREIDAALDRVLSSVR